MAHVVSSMIDFLSLPPSAIKSIFSFLKDKSFLTMREIGKFTYGIVIDTIKTRNINFMYVQMKRAIYDEDAEDVFRLTFLLRDPCPLSLFKLSFIAASYTLGIDYDNFDSDPDVKLCRMFFVVTQSFMARLNSDDTKRFLEYMKPFPYTCETFTMENIGQDVINHCLEFISGKTVDSLLIHPGETDKNFIPSLEIIKQFGTKYIFYVLHGLDKDTIVKIMLQLSEKTSYLSVHNDQIRFTIPEFIKIVQEFFGGKCNKLEINFQFPHLTSSGVEKLLQLFHRAEKKVSFSTRVPTDLEEPSHFQIGVYNVKRENGFLVLKHLDWNKSDN